MPVANRLFRIIVQSAFLIRLMALMLACASSVGRQLTTGFMLWGVLLGASSFLGLTSRIDAIGFVMRHPALAMIDVAIVVTMLSIEGPDNVLMLATLPTALLVGALFRWTTALPLLVVLELGYFGALAAHGVSVADAPYIMRVGIPFIYLAMAAIGQAINYGTSQLTVAIDALHRAQAEKTAALERARLARDMHDSLGKTLHGISLTAASLPHWIATDSDRASALATQLGAHSEVASQEARTLLTGLRRTETDRPLLDLLVERCSQWSQRTKVLARATAIGLVDVDDETRLCILSVVDEALENVDRHAAADSVQVEVTADSQRLQVSIIDDGVGIAESIDGAVGRARYGLLGMRERAESFAGDLSITRNGSRGTRVLLSLPRNAEERTT
ncbi:sensor histidine kinase [Leekyejoonella antrihumi]|nr:histidine kinase [Leekyejoonella antrihumi]